MTDDADDEKRPAWMAEVYPDPADFQELARRFAKAHVVADWCQLCGRRVELGELAWQLPAKRRGNSRPWVCSECFWRDGDPTPNSVHRKVRFRLAHKKPASLSTPELRLAVEALDWHHRDDMDDDLGQLLDELERRVVADKPNLSNALAVSLADALSTLPDVERVDPNLLASRPWVLPDTHDRSWD